jgi:excisionase family DNA binding protein
MIELGVKTLSHLEINTELIGSGLLTEQEAAKILRVRPCTVANLRKDRLLGFLMVGRQVRYSMKHLNEYLQNQETKACESNSPNLDRLAIIGSAKSPAEMGRPIHGAARGTIADPDRHVVSALARQTFTKRPAHSQNG